MVITGLSWPISSSPTTCRPYASGSQVEGVLLSVFRGDRIRHIVITYLGVMKLVVSDLNPEACGEDCSSTLHLQDTGNIFNLLACRVGPIYWVPLLSC